MALDNGLHILIGAYRETLRLIEKVSARDGTADCCAYRSICTCSENSVCARADLPAPLHLATGLLCATGAQLRRALARGAVHGAAASDQLPARARHHRDALLDRFKQGPEARRYLWEPLCVSALNTPPAQASAQVFLNVLRDSLNGTRADSELLLPAVDLCTLFPGTGGALRRGARAARCVTGCAGGSGDAQTAASWRSPAHRAARRSPTSICALPPYRVPEVLGGVPEARPRAGHDFSAALRADLFRLSAVSGRCSAAAADGRSRRRTRAVAVRPRQAVRASRADRRGHQRTRVASGARSGRAGCGSSRRAADSTSRGLPATRCGARSSPRSAPRSRAWSGVQRPEQRTPVPGLLSRRRLYCQRLSRHARSPRCAAGSRALE